MLCAGVTLLAIAAGTLEAAQRSRQSRPQARGPRALAVIEFPPGEKAQPRLVPVSVLDEGRIWDAAVYRATPVPFVLEYGVVYEAEKSGVPQGFFTVQLARPVQNRWIARGAWEPRMEKPEAAPAPVPATPKLDPDAPPILRKPRAEEPAKPSAAEPEFPTPASPQRTDGEDPDRPILRRNVEGKKKDTPIAADEPAAFSVARRLVAISDATAEPSRPYEFKWTPDEERRVREAMVALAAQAVRSRAGSSAKAGAPALVDVNIAAFDLEYDNYGDIVMTARRQHPAQGGLPARDYFVTLVGILDIEGRPRPIFTYVTDSAHLDSQPRLELVDAADADGDGKAELLFHAVGEGRYSYVLYRVFPQNMVRLTETSEFLLSKPAQP